MSRDSEFNTVDLIDKSIFDTATIYDGRIETFLTLAEALSWLRQHDLSNTSLVVHSAEGEINLDGPRLKALVDALPEELA